MSSSTDSDEEEWSFDLRDAFEGKSDDLRALIRTASKVTRHGPTIGDASEDGWRTMLREFLPKRYAVDKAFVVDSRAGQSKQLDIVVHDRHYTPLFWEMGGALYLPAESVYAVFEVKQVLNLKYFGEAADKVESVRKLHRTTAPVTHAGGVYEDPKQPPRILGGLLAGRSSWSPPFGEPLKKGLDRLEGQRRLDLGCGLTHGAFELPESATAVTGLVTADKDVGLAFFAMRLLARLQQMGTVPAVDIDAYTSVLIDRFPR
jgi:hypothetical protein